MFGNDIKMAWASLRGAKLRTIITMLGVIIGVVSVATILSLGNGVKNQVGSHTKKAGPDLITVRPGHPFDVDSREQADLLNTTYGYGFGAGSLSAADLKAVKESPNVGQVSPVNFVAGAAKTDKKEYTGSFVLGTEANFPALINHEMDYGSFFGAEQSNSRVAVIGQSVAREIFEEDIPLGRSFTLRGQTFVVSGVFQQFEPNTIALGVDLNNAIFVPYAISQEISKNSGQLVQILAKPVNPNLLEEVSNNLTSNLSKLHAGSNDFTVITQSEALIASSKTVDRANRVIGGVAVLALLAGGIGIMNIMLLAVTERTREIGIRKAVGATNRQLLGQFWLEAIILSFAGGILGLFGSVFITYLLRIFTNLRPAINIWSLLFACMAAVTVGIIFGMIPAVKAAHKDPIEALRHDI